MIPRSAWLAGLVAALVLGVVTLAAGVLTAGEGGAPLPHGKAITATASINPTVPLFGDQVTARIDIAVDRRKADPSQLHVRAPFSPLEQVAHRRVRADAGRVTFIRYTWTLRCLSRRCAQIQPSFGAAVGGAQGTGRRATTPRPAKLIYRGRPVRSLDWPTVEWLSRTNQTEANSGTYFFHVELAPPPASYAVSPGHLLLWLTLALVLLLAVPAALALRRIVEHRRAQEADDADSVPPLARALQLLEWATSQQDGNARRRALELVAVELRRRGRHDLGAEARALAWQPSPPPPLDADELRARVISTVGGNGARPE